MITNITNSINGEMALNSVRNFLKIEKFEMKSNTVQEGVKELCVAKLCRSLGLGSSKYNYKSDFFEFFSQSFGQALCDKLGIRLIIADNSLRNVKHDGYNFVDTIRGFLDAETMEEAVIDSFKFIDAHKNKMFEIMGN